MTKVKTLSCGILALSKRFQVFNEEVAKENRKAKQHQFSDHTPRLYMQVADYCQKHEALSAALASDDVINIIDACGYVPRHGSDFKGVKNLLGARLEIISSPVSLTVRGRVKGDGRLEADEIDYLNAHGVTGAQTWLDGTGAFLGVILEPKFVVVDTISSWSERGGDRQDSLNFGHAMAELTGCDVITLCPEEMRQDLPAKNPAKRKTPRKGTK